MRSLASIQPFRGSEDVLFRRNMTRIEGDGTRTILERRDMVRCTPRGLRVFATGASRNEDTFKHDPEGFWSPLVVQCYNEYIHKKRFLKDGTIRESDNWQKGMPLNAYAKSMWRHFLDFWLHHRGYGNRARATLIVALCAIMFNTMGYLHEILTKGETTE